MPRTCTICRHAQREEIEKALIASEPYRHLAARYGTSTASLQRHKPHLRRDVIKVYQAVEVERSERLLDCVRTGEGRAERLYASAEAIMVRALESQDLRTALQAIRTAVDVMGEARQYMELRGELSGELGGKMSPPPVYPEARIVITREPRPALEAGPAAAPPATPPALPPSPTR